jgi:hypothetical protein
VIFKHKLCLKIQFMFIVDKNKIELIIKVHFKHKMNALIFVTLLTYVSAQINLNPDFWVQKNTFSSDTYHHVQPRYEPLPPVTHWVEKRMFSDDRLHAIRQEGTVPNYNQPMPIPVSEPSGLDRYKASMDYLNALSNSGPQFTYNIPGVVQLTPDFQWPSGIPGIGQDSVWNNLMRAEGNACKNGLLSC